MNPVLDAARTQRDTVQQQIDAINTKIDELLAAPKSEGRGLNETEAPEFSKLVDERKGLYDKLADHSRTVTDLEAEEQRAEKAAAVTSDTVDTPSTQVRIKNEPHTYDEHDPAAGWRFLRDIAAVFVPQAGMDAGASIERLRRHGHEMGVDARTDKRLDIALREVRSRSGVSESEFRELEQRVNPNTTAGTGGEFVPPLWLVSQFVPYERFDRVVANRVQNFPLPPGIDIINLPKITLGSQTGIQAAQGNAVTSRDITTSTVSAAVRTIAGQEDISLQLLEQSPLAMDGVIFDDLTRDYDMQLDTQLWSGTGANGQHQGVLTLTSATSNTDITKANAVTVSSATFHDSSTSGTQYRSILNGKNQIETLRVAPATAIWVNPRRANSWEYSAVDSTNRPLFVAYQPFNALGVDNPNMAQGVAGALAGLPVVKDGNCPTTMNATATTGGTADPIVIVRESDLYLWEGTLRLRALPEILSGTLQIRFQAYAYSAFMPNRYPPSISILTGNTGLAAPGF